jgi:hypothetical protein
VLGVLEAVVAGAVVFAEAANPAVAAYLCPGQEAVAFTELDLEPLLEDCLADEARRQTFAQRARERALQFAMDNVWRSLADGLHAEWPDLEARCQQRLARGGGPDWLGRVWQQLGARDGGDPGVKQELTQALAAEPDSARLHSALGVLLLHEAGPGMRSPAEAIAHLRRALELFPQHAVAAFSAVEVQGTDPRSDPARLREAAQSTLTMLACGYYSSLYDEPPLLPGFGLLRAEWERAAWENVGRADAEAEAKHRLMAWCLHCLLGRMDRPLEAMREAALARPDLPTTQGALGGALMRAGQSAQAANLLRRELVANPFDAPLAAGLYQVLRDSGDFAGVDRLSRSRRLLSRAAPQDIPPEPWFSEDPAQAAARRARGGALAVAVIVTVHNEEDLILAFLEHYTGLGVDAFLVLNNESTDRTMELAGRFAQVSVVETASAGQLDDLVRYVMIQRQRAACIGRFDYVLLVDADEFIVPKEGGLKETLARLRDQGVLGCEGFDVVQGPGEGPYDPARPLLGQRGWGVPNRMYDKPVVLRPEAPAHLVAGLHRLAGPIRYPPVTPFWLLHFAAFDEGLYFKRRRKMVARQGERNRRLGYAREYTDCTEADLRRRWEALQNHPQRRPLPTRAAPSP